MPTRVLDSWALLAYLQDEPAAGDVEQLLAEAETPGNELLLSVINWGEVYYSVHRSASPAAAERAAVHIAAMPIRLVPVSEDLALVRQAAAYKATRRMAYADCFAAALARLHGVEVVTGDPEFEQVADEVQVRWVGR